MAILFPIAEGVAGLERSLEAIFAQVDEAIAQGVNIFVLSDRDMHATQAPIPALLATSGLHHHLIRTGKRTQVRCWSNRASRVRCITLPC